MCVFVCVCVGGVLARGWLAAWARSGSDLAQIHSAVLEMSPLMCFQKEWATPLRSKRPAVCHNFCWRIRRDSVYTLGSHNPFLSVNIYD